MRATVNKIIPFSMVDGPGSRSSIFLQGCNMSCAYCHNPETQRACIHCGDCVLTCPVKALSIVNGQVVWDSELCVNCDTCIKICAHRSSPKLHEMSAEEVFAQLSLCQPFIRGVTVSGGECMLYPEFLCELFALCKEAGLSTLIDSNGSVDFSEPNELMGLTDGVMLDVKAWDDSVHERLTGISNEQVKANLAWLSKVDKLEEVRIVVVDGWTDPITTIEGVAEVLGDKVSTTRLKLIAFRSFGVVGELAGAPSPSSERMEELATIAHSRGFVDIVLT